MFVEYDIDKFNKVFFVKLDLESFWDIDVGLLELVVILWNDGEFMIKFKVECFLS